MGDPSKKRYRADNGKTYWVPLEVEADFVGEMQGAGIRVTPDRSPMGPLPGQHYGPLDPNKLDQSDAMLMAQPTGRGLPALPEDFGLDTSSPLDEHGRHTKLAQRPVPPQPYFPPKGTAESLPGGVPNAVLAQGPMAPIDDLDAGVGDVGAGAEDVGGVPQVDPLATSREALDRVRGVLNAEAMAARGPLRDDARVTGRTVDAPPAPGMLETVGRSAADLYSLGLDDVYAGIGAMGDELARNYPSIANRYLDPTLRLFGHRLGADIPMQVSRQVMGEGRNLQRDESGEVLRDESGNALREPGKLETRTQMSYTEPAEGEGATVTPREPVQHNFLQGEHGVPMTTFDTYLNAGSDMAKDYEAANEAAFEANPGARLTTALLTGAPLAVLMRRFGSRTPVLQEVEQATARAGPGTANLLKRSLAGAKDAAMNPGNIGAAVTSGVGHAQGDTLPEFALDAALQGVGEMGVNIAASPFAEILLDPPRMFGRDALRKLRSSKHNPFGWQTLHTAMDQGGTRMEAFAKPAEGKGMWGHPLTSEMGVRPGAMVNEAEAASLARGSVTPAADLRSQAADAATAGLSDQHLAGPEWIRRQKDAYYLSPEGQREIPEGLVLDHLPPTASKEARIRIDARRREPPPWKPQQYPEEPAIRRDAEGHRLAPEGTAARKMREFQENPPPPNQRMINAQELDAIIQIADDEALSFKNTEQHGAKNDWAEYAAHLRQIRNSVYLGLDEIDRTGRTLLNRFEANANQLGIPENVSSVDTTAGSAHSTRAYERLQQTQENPRLRDTLERLRDWNPEAEQLMNRSRGVDATQRLIMEAKKGGPAAAARARAIGPELPPRISVPIPDLTFGMRTAGLENLGLNSNAIVREAMSKAVTPEDLEYIYRLLGIRPDLQNQEQQPK